jgi:hypothetical protein
MEIEHCVCLSWFSVGCESHEQDGETLSRTRVARHPKASGDPAMAFKPPLRRTGAVAPGSNVGSGLAAGDVTNTTEAFARRAEGFPRGTYQRRMPSLSINVL